MPRRRPSLKKSLRAIELAFADIATLAEALSDRVRVAKRLLSREPGTTPGRWGKRRTARFGDEARFGVA